jgi:hypothetical protein
LPKIENKIGNTALEDMGFRVVLTVPKSWSPDNQQSLKLAASKAGIDDTRYRGIEPRWPSGNAWSYAPGDRAAYQATFPQTMVTLVSESDAAAHTLCQEILCQRDSEWQTGDVFIMSGLGGYMVELFAHKIVALDPVRFEALDIRGMFVPAGSADVAFRQTMKKKLGSSAFERFYKHDEKRIILNQWEQIIKKRFDGSQNASVFVPGYNPLKWFLKSDSEKRIHFTAREVREIFKSSIDSISQRLKAFLVQLGENHVSPKTILCYGGFSENPYLISTLRNSFPTIPLLQTKYS